MFRKFFRNAARSRNPQRRTVKPSWWKRLEFEALEDRILPTTLTDVINTAEQGVQLLQNASIASQALNQANTIKLVSENLATGFGLDADLQAPFQQFNPTASLDWNADPNSVVNQLQKNGFQILYPDTTTTMRWPGTPDGQGNLLIVRSTTVPQQNLPGFDASGLTGFSYLDDGAVSGLNGVLTAKVASAQLTVTFGVDLYQGAPHFFVATTDLPRDSATVYPATATNLVVSANATGSVSGDLNIGDTLKDVQAQATATLNISSASIGFKATADGKLHDFSNLGNAVAGNVSGTVSIDGGMSGNTRLPATFTVHSSFLPDLTLNLPTNGGHPVKSV
jgi:hypothetical protein